MATRLFLYLSTIILISCNRYSQPNKLQLEFEKGFYNWHYDSTSTFYFLDDYPSGVKKLFPVIENYSLDENNTSIYITGILTLPSLNNMEMTKVKNAPIIYAVPVSNQKIKLRFISNLGSTDSTGKFFINIPAPSGNFYILFAKDDILPAAVKFLIKRSN